MTPAEIGQLKKQNAQLLRALLRAQRELAGLARTTSDAGVLVSGLESSNVTTADDGATNRVGGAAATATKGATR